MDREATIKSLTANCNCGCGADTLNKLSDDELAKLKTNADRAAAMGQTLAKIGKKFKLDPSISLNEMPEALAKFHDEKAKGKDNGDEEEKDTEEMEQNGGAGQAQADGGGPGIQAGGKGTKEEYNTNAWLAKAPPTVRDAVRYGIEARNRDKMSLANRIVANAGAEGEVAKQMHAQLMRRGIDDLKFIAGVQPVYNALPTVNDAADQSGEPTLGNLPSYLGVGPTPPLYGSPTANLADDDVLPLPVMNWDKKQTA